MDTMLLEATERQLVDKAKALRASGRIPAVFYGRGQKNRHLLLDYQAFRKVYVKAGGNTIVELVLDSKKFPVLVHDVVFDPVTDAFAHVDFIHVDMDKEVTTMVKVVAVGLAPAVKNLGGVLDIQKHEIKIKCLPKDLIHSIDVDVTSIVDFHTTIHVSDLKIPAAIKVLDRPEDAVATVVPPRAEEEAAKPAEAAVVGAPGEAGAAPAEGAAAPAAAAGAAPAAGGKEKK